MLISLGTLYGCAPESAAVSETGKEKTEAGAESSEAGTEYPEEGAGDTEEGTETSGLGNDSPGTEKAPLEAEAKSRKPGAENGETEFYVDGAACRVELPDSEHAKKELDRAVDLGNGESCVLASLDQYEGAAVLTIAPGEATSALGPQTADSIRQRVRIKSGEDESPAFRISFSESGDEIKMLFLTRQGEEEPKLLLDGEALG